MEFKIRRVVKALEICDNVLTDENLREFRSKHLLNSELASGKWSEIQAIRQSGDRGTSIFNWITNFVLWTCVLEKDPWVFVGKSDGKNGKRRYIVQEYTCAFTGKKNILRFVFEGDDSILGSMLNLASLADQIELEWSRLGFRMKLIFHDTGSVATFTGYTISWSRKTVWIEIPSFQRCYALLLPRHHGHAQQKCAPTLN